MRVFVTGGTGLVGGRLIHRLLERGDQVALLSRRPDHAKNTFGDKVAVVEGDPAIVGPWQAEIANCDGVVNLAGEGIFNKRWSDEFKKAMRQSRVPTTENVAAALNGSPRRADGSPKVLVSASAIGYYGPHDDEELTESSDAAGDYLAMLCVDWERAALAAQRSGVRVVVIRIGVVLDKAGGALQKMLPPFKMFVGGPVGSGRQYMSWIHLDDLVGMILFSLDRPNVSGVLNGTAPNPVTNKQFSKALGHVLGRPSFMPTPAFALRVMLGEVANVVTKGQRVLPTAALNAGYPFKFTEIEPALRDILAK